MPPKSTKAPPIVREWVQKGMRLTPGIKRGDMILCPLQLPVVSALDTLIVGLYCFRESNANIVPEIKIVFSGDLWFSILLADQWFRSTSHCALGYAHRNSLRSAREKLCGRRP